MFASEGASGQSVGRYAIHVRISHAEHLLTVDGQLCDPFVVVEMSSGHTYQTAFLQDKARYAYWGEQIMWDTVELSDAEFRSSFITFRVKGMRWFSRNDTLGSASVKLSAVSLPAYTDVPRQECLQLSSAETSIATGQLFVTLSCLKQDWCAQEPQSVFDRFGEQISNWFDPSSWRLHIPVEPDPNGSEVEIRIVIRDANWRREASLDTHEIIAARIDAILEATRSQWGDRKFRISHPERQKTDINFSHHGCNATFDWRVVFPGVVSSARPCMIQVVLFNADLLGDDHMMGEEVLDLTRHVEQVSRRHKRTNISFALPLRSTPSNVDASQDEVGHVHLDVCILPQSEANRSRVGLGREDPQDYPRLLTPRMGRGWSDLSAFDSKQDQLDV